MTRSEIETRFRVSLMNSPKSQIKTRLHEHSKFVEEDMAYLPIDYLMVLVIKEYFE